jgi:hypothetical protein
VLCSAKRIMIVPQPQDEQTVVSSTSSDVELLADIMEKAAQRISETSIAAHTVADDDSGTGELNMAANSADDVEPEVAPVNVTHRGYEPFESNSDQDNKKVALPGAYRITGAGRTRAQSWDDDSTVHANTIQTTVLSGDGSIFVIPRASLVSDDKTDTELAVREVVVCVSEAIDPDDLAGGKAKMKSKQYGRRGWALVVCLVLLLAFAIFFTAVPRYIALSRRSDGPPPDRNGSDRGRDGGRAAGGGGGRQGGGW